MLCSLSTRAYLCGLAARVKAPRAETAAVCTLKSFCSVWLKHWMVFFLCVCSALVPAWIVPPLWVSREGHVHNICPVPCVSKVGMDTMLARLLCLGEVQAGVGRKVFPKPLYCGNFFPPESVIAENIDGICGLKT